MSEPQKSSVERDASGADGVVLSMSLGFDELDRFCADVNFDHAADREAWNILSRGLCEAVQMQPTQAQKMIEQLAASTAPRSRVLAAFAVGPLAVSLPTERPEPVQELWATLLGDESDEVSTEAARHLLTMERDGELSHEFFRAVFARAFHATE